jgi:hypothetical protein
MRTKAADSLDQIHSHPGAQYINRAYQRSFSLNIFRGNTFELQARLHSYTHPDRSLELFLKKNKEEGLQAHREIIRLLHNFVCSAATLVEHTRNFVKENYLGSSVNREFTSRINREFSENGMTKFVHELRNYIVHRGLPPTTANLVMTQDPERSPGVVSTSSSYLLDVSILTEWDGWTKHARSYLARSGDNIDLKELVRNYATAVGKFHNDFDSLVAAHHQNDVEELKALRTSLGFDVLDPFSEESEIEGDDGSQQSS